MVTLTQLPNSWPTIASFGPTLKDAIQRNTKAFKFDMFTEDNSGIHYANHADLTDFGITSMSRVGNLRCSNNILLGTLLADYTIANSFGFFHGMQKLPENILEEVAQVDITPLIDLGFKTKALSETDSVSGIATSVLQVTCLYDGHEVRCLAPCKVLMKFSRKSTLGDSQLDIALQIDVNQLAAELSKVFMAANNLLTANFGTVHIEGTAPFELDISTVE